MTQRNAQKLEKFLAYVLGRRPDEFGLVPDPDGWVAVRDLLKALNEEEGWRHVRQAALNEVVTTLFPSGIELDGSRIRAKDRGELPRVEPAGELPKLLFTCVRSKAHFHVLDHDLDPLGGLAFLLLSPDKERALRLGRRHDAEPVLITVNTVQAVAAGVLFSRLGTDLFLARRLPAGSFSAPPPPKVREEVGGKAGGKGAGAAVPTAPKMPGSYIITPDMLEERLAQKRRFRENERGRDQERRRQRRRKQGGE